MIDADNVFDIFALAQTYNLPRLEDAVVAHFAMNIDDILPMPQACILMFDSYVAHLAISVCGIGNSLSIFNRKATSN